MSIDIINLVSQTIVESQQEKYNRYIACGCASCQVRAKKIKSWLNPDTVIVPPDEVAAQTGSQIPPLIPMPQAAICPNCLRMASTSQGHCPYCGAEGQANQ